MIIVRTDDQVNENASNARERVEGNDRTTIIVTNNKSSEEVQNTNNRAAVALTEC